MHAHEGPMRLLTKIFCGEYVTGLATSCVNLLRHAIDRHARLIKGIQQLRLYYPGARRNQSVCLKEKGDFEQTIVTKEADTAPAFVIASGFVWKIQSHLLVFRIVMNGLYRIRTFVEKNQALSANSGLQARSRSAGDPCQ